MNCWFGSMVGAGGEEERRRGGLYAVSMQNAGIGRLRVRRAGGMGGWGQSMPYVYALYVCLICMPYMYALYACLICMPCMYALCVCLPWIRRMPMHALYVCLICMPYVYALYVRLICMPYMDKAEWEDGGRVCPHTYALYVSLIACLICMPYMHALYVWHV